MVVNLHKTKETVFRRTSIRLVVYSDPLVFAQTTPRPRSLSAELDIVFNSLILSRLQYAVPGGFLSADLVGMVNALLKRAFKYGYTNSLYRLLLSHNSHVAYYRAYDL